MHRSLVTSRVSMPSCSEMSLPLATIADTLNRTLMEAQQCTEDEQAMRTTLVDAAQLHVQLLGAVADEASGSRTMGDLSM